MKLFFQKIAQVVVLMVPLILSCESVNVTAIDVGVVEVSPGQLSLSPGARDNFTVRVSDGAGNALSGRGVTWSSSNPGLVSVDESGGIVALGPGEVTIRALAEGITGTAIVFVNATGELLLSTRNISLQVQPGLSASPVQISISNTGGGSLTNLAFSVAYVAGSSGWLSVSFDRSTAPAILTVAPLSGVVDGLDLGTYRATISVSAPNASNSARIAVELVVRAPEPAIGVSPASGSFAMSEGGDVPTPQVISLTNAGGKDLTGLATSVAYDQNPTTWLNASLSGSSAPATLTLSIAGAASNLPIGIYTASVRISAPTAVNSPIDVLVTLTVGNPPPTIALSAATLAFQVGVGQASPPQQSVTVTNMSGGALESLSTAVQYDVAGPNWLRVSLGSTSAPATLSLTTSTTGLAIGDYRARVLVSSPLAVNTQELGVTLRIQAPPILVLGSTEVAFSASESGSDPAPVDVAITNTGEAVLAGLAASVVEYVGVQDGWLSVTFSDSTTAPATLRLTPTLGTLTADTLMARVEVVGLGAVPDTIEVTFEISLTGPDAPTGLTSPGADSTSISLRFTDNARNEAGFSIERRLAGTSFWGDSIVIAANVGTGSVEVTDVGLTPGTRYDYRVRANNSIGVSAWLEQVPGFLTDPVAATLDSVRVVGPTTVAVLWTGNNGNATVFDVHRSTDGSSPWAVLVTGLPSATVSYTDNAAVEGGANHYRVITRTPGSRNVISNVLSVTTTRRTPSTTTSLITAAPALLVADGVATSTIGVQLRDVTGANLSFGGDAVVLVTTLGTIGPVTDNLDGTYRATLTSSTTTGTAAISGTVNGVAMADGALVTMSSGVASGATSQITASPTTLSATGTATSTITVQLQDANSNNLPAGGDAVVLSTTLGRLGAVSSAGGGRYTATLTSGTAAGTATITGTVNGGAITDNATVTIAALVASGSASLITASPTSLVANGVTTSTITVRLRASGNVNLVVGGDAVVLSTTLGTLGTVTDNANGRYTATLTSGTTVGTATITGTVNGAAITDNATVAHTAGSASGATSQITASPTTLSATGTATSTITVQLQDANGNNLPAGGDAVVLSTTLGGLGAVSSAGGGRYTATLTSGTAAGTATITGMVNGGAIADNATVTIAALVASGSASLITASPTSLVANGVTTSTITVRLRASGNINLVLGGDAVVLSTTLGTLGPVTDNANGRYTATLTSGTTVGTAAITGTVNGAAITDNATVAHTAGSASGVTSQITASPTSISSTGTATSTITVQLRDANGNNLPAGGDAVVLSTTLGTLGAVSSAGGGRYTATLTSGTAAGTATITGTVNGGGITDNATVTVTALVASGATSLITASPTTLAAGGVTTSTLTVRLRTSGGTNLVLGGDVVVLTTTLGTIGTVTDNVNGTYTATLTSGTSVGTATVTGTVNGTAITDNATVAHTAGAASGATSQITASPITISATGAATSTITVQLRDANGNNLSTGGDAVTLSTTLGALGAVTSAGSGRYTATLTSGTAAGTATITGTVNGGAITDNATVTIAALVASGTASLITASPTSLVANGVTTSSITVRLRAAGNVNLVVGGDAVVLSTTLGTLGTVTDNANGTYTATLTSGTTVGTATITGTVNGAAITDNATVAHTAGSASGATSQITASPTTLSATGTATSTITVQLRDANGNNLPGGGDAVVLSTTLGTLGAVSSAGGGRYTATLTSGTAAGTATITGTVNGGAITDNATVTITPLVASGPASLITASPTSLVANGVTTSTITVRLRASGNVNLVLGGDAVVLSTTLGTLGTVTDNANGTYTATLTSGTTVGTATITGTVNGAAITDNATVAHTAGSASGATSQITASPTTLPATGTATSTITVQLRDANGNNLPGGGDAVVLSTTLGTLGAVSSAGGGRYTATLTSGTAAGTATITGTVNGGGITDNATVTVTALVASGATSTITAAPTSLVGDGVTTSTITVQLRNAAGVNLVLGGDAVVLSTTLGTLGAVTDNGNGTYTATLTSGTTTGTATITGTVNGAAITGTATVTHT